MALSSPSGSGLDGGDPSDFTAGSMSKALLNILEDLTEEGARLRDTQLAIMNMMEDVGGERQRFETIQYAVLNILDDFHQERSLFQDGQKASLNILEDFAAERNWLECTQKAVYNILDDFDSERTKVEAVNQKLRHEIDERIAIERTLVEKSEALARSNAELEQFAYIASHDLQAPLRTISSFLEIIAETAATQIDETTRRHFGYVVDGVTRMQNLIKALLDYSRVGRESPPFRRLSCATICSEVQRDLYGVICELGAVVSWEGLPHVYGDFTMLRQLFQNLIGNAIKFHAYGETPRVTITAKQLGSKWEIRVEDNGIGIDKSLTGRLFVIFQRLHSRDKYPGTGIGLAICKKIVEVHGGRIWIEPSTSGRGTVFAFTLPQAAEVAS